MSVMDAATVSFTKHGHIFVNPVVLNRLYNKTEIREYHMKAVADKQLTGHPQVRHQLPLHHSRPW